jgi:hypothetical protein
MVTSQFYDNRREVRCLTQAASIEINRPISSAVNWRSLRWEKPLGIRHEPSPGQKNHQMQHATRCAKHVSASRAFSFVTARLLLAWNHKWINYRPTPASTVRWRYWPPHSPNTCLNLLMIIYAGRHLYFHWSVNFYFYLGEALICSALFFKLIFKNNKFLYLHYRILGHH